MKIFLLDSNSIICRYFFAIPEMFTEDGINVNGLFGYCRLIKDIISNNQNEEFAIIATFDRCSQNFRKDICENYKKNRKKADSSLIVQLGLAEEFCRNIKIPVEYHLNYEADDIIASIVSKYEEKNEIFILSTDKDLMQLINEKVKIFNPFSKQIIDKEAVKEKFGLFPEDVGLFLALCGDSSDNIKGIAGVGAKTAVNIINKTKDPDVMKREFPKFDFSELDKMISLTKLNTDYEVDLINLFNINIVDLNTNLSKFNFNSIKLK